MGQAVQGGTGLVEHLHQEKLQRQVRVGQVEEEVRCDIRTKIDITSLTNQNLIKDDLATVAYFVQELRGE